MLFSTTTACVCILMLAINFEGPVCVSRYRYTPSRHRRVSSKIYKQVVHSVALRVPTHGNRHCYHLMAL